MIPQGIGKGQVRQFILCMDSDDLETKNRMVEALRLTEPNPTRLLRFVNQGGLMKLVSGLHFMTAMKGTKNLSMQIGSHR